MPSRERPQREVTQVPSRGQFTLVNSVENRIGHFLRDGLAEPYRQQLVDYAGTYAELFARVMDAAHYRNPEDRAVLLDATPNIDTLSIVRQGVIGNSGERLVFVAETIALASVIEQIVRR